MLVCVFGTPTPFASLVAGIIEGIGEANTPGSVRLPIQTLDELRKAIASHRDTPDFVVGVCHVTAEELNASLTAHADAPWHAAILCHPADEAMIGLCKSERIPIVAAADGLAVTAHTIAEHSRLGLAYALRVATGILCMLEPLYRDLEVMRLARIGAPFTIDDAVLRVGAFLGMDGSAIGGERLASLRAAWTVIAGTRGDDLPQSEAAALAVLGQSYDTILSGEKIRTFIWPQAGFLRLAPAENGVIELTGPVRTLSFGPYYHLPRGRYRADIAFETSGNRSSNRLSADVYNGSFLALGEMMLTRSGAFTFSLSFEITEPWRAIEQRWVLWAGSIGGKLLLKDVVIHRLGEDGQIGSSGPALQAGAGFGSSSAA